MTEQTNTMKEWMNKRRNKQMNEEMTPKKILNMTLKGKHLKVGLGSWWEQVKKDTAQKDKETWQKLVEEKLWTGTDRQRTWRAHTKWKHWEESKKKKNAKASILLACYCIPEWFQGIHWCFLKGISYHHLPKLPAENLQVPLKRKGHSLSLTLICMTLELQKNKTLLNLWKSF